MRRLNVGCGPFATRGWINLDRAVAPAVDVVYDLRNGLPIGDAECDYVVAIHVLQDLPYLDVLPILRELRRVLRPDGVLRLGLPDLDRAIDAYRAARRDYVHVPDADATSIGGKLVAQIVWYGSVRTPFTFDTVEELLAPAGFRAAWRAAYRETRTVYADIVALDNRPRESLFVEAVR